MHLIVRLILLCFAGQGGLGARILGLFPVPTKSHLSITSPLMHALAKKGHDVTMFVPFPTGFNATNYREIIYESPPLGSDLTITDYFNVNFVRHQFFYYDAGISVTEMVLTSQEAQSLIGSKEKYDVVVMEQFASEALLVYVNKLECPVVLVSTFRTTSTINGIFGNSAPWSYVPAEFISLDDRMTLFERLQNALALIFIEVTRKYYYMPRQQALAAKYLGDANFEIPDLEELERRADLILINTHPAFSSPRPYMATMKDVAGMHIKPAKPLSSELHRYMESSEKGVIFFCLGSIFKSIEMPEHLIGALKKAFERVPYDVLWKWENNTMTDKPKNVRIEKWLPQNDILAHPKLKVFVTHGGISSLLETVYHKVPIVGIPIFGDQRQNIKLARTKGFVEVLNFSTMTEDDIYEAIVKVANDPKYKRNVEKVSAYWRGEMNHPLDVAVHSVEYVIRNNGTKHLKPAVMEQTFVQYFLLDLAFVVSTVSVLAFLALRQMLKLLIRRKSCCEDKLKKIN
ncbi:UDP-glycosyltransferase UGT5-like [Athalia rosae]|uniref:UDP-glycosyltransferase UGT5-like n=1 Tax=Athalia rosae TaxID=37344 RepID=UPI002033849D|nr:UDP-glycosyltransferase UGT5-like [Athalia rosae]